MKEQLSIVKFLTSVKVKEESNYCRDCDFAIERDGEIFRVEDRKSHQVSYVPIHNVSYWKVKATAPVVEVEAEPAPAAPTPTPTEPPAKKTKAKKGE